ncbi:replication protein, partial [Bacillus cereus]|nr:replication protein [Bacillus cereus]MED2439944.1 replication protein [Bacillus thuringiensis]
MAKKNQDEITGKLQPKKKQNIKIYEFIKKKMSESGKELFKSCSIFNEFLATKDKKKKKRVKGNDCKNR